MPMVGPALSAAPNSPFFRPSDKPDFTQTPGGTRHVHPREGKDVEHKSTIVGCSSNLINAIVGSGIVGLPFAVKEAGSCAGIALVILCGLLTEKSLRLLIETAKHAHVPSYETVAEAAFGKSGFLFVAISTFRRKRLICGKPRGVDHLSNEAKHALSVLILFMLMKLVFVHTYRYVHYGVWGHAFVSNDCQRYI
jgi:hypothetical protein